MTVSHAVERARAGENNAATATSDFVTNMRKNNIIEVINTSKKLQADGVEVLNSLCVGRPDYPPADEVKNALIDAVNKNMIYYTEGHGTLELRQAICDDILKRKGVRYEPEMVVISNGGQQAIYQAFMAKCDIGDEIVVPVPAWTSYIDLVNMARATPIVVHRDPNNN